MNDEKEIRVLLIDDEETLLEELAGLRTLRRIIEWHRNNMVRAESEPEPVAKKKKLTPAPPVGEKDVQTKAGPGSRVVRYEVRPVPAPLVQFPDQLKDFPEDHLIVLAGEAPAISGGLHAALSSSNYRIRHLDY